MGQSRELTDGWKFRETGQGDENGWAPALHVPGTIHTDLMHNGRIADPFVNMNELSVRWVAERSWTYRTSFRSPERQSDSKVDLVFKGLDTFAEVKLNGKTILNADNMFFEYRIDITEHLKRTDTDENELEILFESALLKGRTIVKEHEHEHRFIAHQTEQGRLPVRKAQYHWGWDWGPILTTAGIWKPILLETYLVRINDLWMDYKISDDLTSVKGTLFARVESPHPRHGRKVQFDLSLEGTSYLQQEAEIDSTGLSKTTFSLQPISLWHPHGYGRQPLYNLKASLEGSDNASRMKCVAFRNVELIQENDDFGKSFYFRINGIDIFCGGSNWIPADSFLPSVDPDRYRKWLKLMIDGNQLMTRVWGGGIYEDDAFYGICDELGILVWQDFCMACASYPAYGTFLKQIEEEARYQIKRLRNHPSLVIWAGNNEDYQIQERYNLDYDYDTDKDPQSWLKGSFPARYIYEYLLPKIVNEETPGAAYHPSSPWGDGKKSFDPTVGDIHQWNVWHGVMKRYQEYPSIGGRFVSEFGMEAYPHLETIRSAITDPAQQYPGSAVLDYHNRAVDHERRLMTYVVENFRIKHNLASFAHLTQITQADAMASAYRSWRRQWNREGQRQCAGVLTWQLNDCWPTMSWAIVDYWLVKKPAFYTIARALQPLAVGVSRPHHAWTIGHSDPTIAMTDRRYDVWVASNLLEARRVEIEVRLYFIETGKEIVRRELHRDVEAQPNATTEVCKNMKVMVEVPEVAHEPMDDDDQATWIENQAGYFKYPARHKKDLKPFDMAAYDPFVIYVRLTEAGSNDRSILSEDTVWPQPLKYLDFAGRGVVVSLDKEKQEVVITAVRPVKGFVFEEKREWAVFSDNGFDVMPGIDKIVKLSGSRIQKVEELSWMWIGMDD